MSAAEQQHISLALYHHISRNIVGSKDTVKAKRFLTTVSDNISYGKHVVQITSGSFGEGLEMTGSDFDFMFVPKSINVYENNSDINWDICNSYFEINTNDTKLGFVRLHLRHTLDRNLLNLCDRINGGLVLSNTLFKQYFANTYFRYGKHLAEVNHGPCLSDKEGLFDFAYCLHSKSWISQADQWVNRPRRKWPSNEVISMIIAHGTLFVPIGVKGSPNEDIEWRISFSVGEKLLIYSFNHTQFLYYALMKILLKDVISVDVRCKDLLCSYFLKNILFWVLEETSLSIWKPQNLIECFMQCLTRLIYCVEYSLCPHFFIPENNMFENRIEGHSRHVLLEKHCTLYNLGWRGILFSPQLQDFWSVNIIRENNSFVDYIEQINVSSASIRAVHGNYGRTVMNVLFCKSKTIKRYYNFYLISSCQNKAEKMKVRHTDTNKKMYRKFKLCQSYLAQILCSDVVSGWLTLASFYYTMKQYRNVLIIAAYAISKCTREIFYGKYKLSAIQCQLLTSKIFQRKGLLRVLQLMRLESVHFDTNSTLIPRELELEILTRHHRIPPVLFGHFLSFLCCYHLDDVSGYRHSLADLQLTVSEECFIADTAELSVSYNVLGVAFQMIGEPLLARKVFLYAISLDPGGIHSCAKQRLSEMEKL